VNRNQPVVTEFGGVELVPARRLGLEGRMTGGDAFSVDGVRRWPVLLREWNGHHV
jgi:hypothetical protein